MQSAADPQTVRADLTLEIRPRLPAPLLCVTSPPTSPPSAASPSLSHLHDIGIVLQSRSRLLRIQGLDRPLLPREIGVLSDPLTEDVEEIEGRAPYVDVFCRPGVTDAEGETAALALRYSGLDGVVCRAGLRYRFAGPVDRTLRPAIERAIGNALIHEMRWSDQSDEIGGLAAAGATSHVPWVETVPLRHLSDRALAEVSRERGLALNAGEMRTIAAHFDALGRDPTDVELQSVALAWSEHCSHKTFKATIEMEHNGRRETISGLLRACLVAPTATLARPWVRSAFVDNAGVIAFDGRHDLAIKVETHNHPSALEPFGGAHTGVGGVIRDVLAMSAEPIANTDVLCFGPPHAPEWTVPAGAFHPSVTYREVVRGVADYGNNMGIPTVGGAILFHPGYTANPLVFCGTVGISPRDSHPRDPQPGDLIVLLGGRTGRDGLQGATMSSADLHRETVAGSTVQIGDPIVEKTVRDVLPHLRDARLYHAITDCGAGGLCSAVGEMAETLGADVDLALVPLKYEGLRPWEIWLSEAQERMVLAVAPTDLPRVVDLCRRYDVMAAPIGRFRGDGLLRLRHGDGVVGEIDTAFLQRGGPPVTLQARWTDRPTDRPEGPGERSPGDLAASLLRLLAHPTIGSKEAVIRQYDHEVGAGTVIKPLVGSSGPSDAAVLCPLPDSRRGAVIAHGINPLYGEIDPHAMATLAVDEALRNLVAVGGSIGRAALLDNFCWGDVDDPEGLGRLVRAAQGCRDAALAYRVPFISGKDSLRNTSVDAEGRHSIPGTLLITALGVVPDVGRAVTMDFKCPGNRLYLLGTTADELGWSHWTVIEGVEGGQVPRIRPETPRLMRRLTRAIRAGLVAACHDLSEGGLAVAAAEMAIAGGMGLDIDLEEMSRETDEPIALLFGETPGRFLVEVAEGREEEFERAFLGLPVRRIGQVTEERQVVMREGEERVIDLPLEDVEGAWRGEGPHPLPPLPCAGEGEERAVFAAHRNAPSPRGVRTMVLAAPGVNCDRETAEACRAAGADVEVVHLNALLSGERRAGDFGFLVFPGGFSYGDHLGAGAMLATVLRHRLLEDLVRFVEDGRPVLGICNGFQILARLGLLGEVGLAANEGGRFQCRWVSLRADGGRSIFLRGLETFDLPIANGQGRVVIAPDATEDVLRRAPLRYRENPNGSAQDIAGVCNPMGNVFGLMPHPERFVECHHHPRWSAGWGVESEPTGLAIFRNAIQYVREEL